MVLKIEGLAYRRAGQQQCVLDDIDLSVAAGEIVCLLGPNGSGKTTLLRCLIGALAPLRGTIRIDGESVPTARRLARKLAYVAQDGMHSEQSVLDTVLMGRTPHLPPLALPGRQDEHLARAALARVGIAHLAPRPLHRISGGERQLALIARALAQGPRLLLMDEPSASLDLGNQVRVLRTIRELADDGIAILVTTHQPEHALLLGARVGALAAGRMVGAGPAREVLQAQMLERLYGTPIDVLDHHGVPTACVPRL